MQAQARVQPAMHQPRETAMLLLQRQVRRVAAVGRPRGLQSTQASALAWRLSQLSAHVQ